MQVLRRLCLVFVLVVGAGNVTISTSASTPPENKKPPNIILITLDTTRADRMGFLGSKRGLTPNLDALARHSVVFTRAYAQFPLTTPSHAALLTGTYPQYNHVANLGSTLRPEIPYLPDVLHQHGYHTAAFIGALILDPKGGAPGFDRGFDMYDADFHVPKGGEDRYHSAERRAEDVANHAMGWLSQHREAPFFLWLHFYDPHEPYDPPEPFKSHFASDPYDGEIAYTDSVVGSVLEILQRHGLYQNTAIAVAADHGEAFGEHGERWHGMFLYDETIHVPLILKLPQDRLAGKRVEARVGLVDVAPSLLEIAKVPAPAAMQGESLFPIIDSPKSSHGSQTASKGNKPENKPGDRAIYSETNYAQRAFGWSELRSWRVQKYLYVQAPKKELYDESSDPKALKNLADTATAVTGILDGQLSSFRKRTSGAPVADQELSLAQAEDLRALGYLSSNGNNSSSAEGKLTDPKDKIDYANKLHDILFDEGNYEEALAKMQELVREYDSDAGITYLEFGKYLFRRGKYQEAVSALRSAVARIPDFPSAHYELGLALIKTDQWEAAVPEFQTAVERQPTSAQFHFYLAGVQSHLKHVPEATKEYEKALEINPGYFEANLMYGRLLSLEQHPDAALPKLLHAARINPDSAEVHAFLADAYRQLGQTENAERERTKAAELKAEPPQ
jgi:arylsulfatase A-like enzyme/Flp pilus assembly protein TadD